MLVVDRLAPQSDRAIQTVRQILGEASNLNNPVVAGAAAMMVGIGIGFAMSGLLSGEDGEVARLRADADDLKQRIDKLRR